jgi:hypothetical protein
VATVSSLPTRGLSEAKAALSDVMSGVVHDHQPTVIERHGGKEAMLLLGLSDMGPLLDHFSFHTLSSVSDGEFVLRLQELGLVAGGDTFEQAAAELEDLAVTYAERYFERLHFYAQTDRAEQMPWLLRLILTPEADRRALLIGEKIHPTPFREALSSGEPVPRPAPPDTEHHVEHDAWVLAVLTSELHMTAEQI